MARQQSISVPTFRDVPGLLALAAIYFGAAKLGLFAAVTHKVVSSAWPPSGVALAALLLLGVRYWPGIALGAFVLNWTSDIPAAGAAGIAVGNTLEAVTGALLLQRIAHFRPSLERLHDVLALVGFAALASTTTSATFGVTSLWASGVVDRSAAAHLWFAWWSGDAMGVLLVAPLLLTWSRPSERPQGRAWLEMAGLVLVLVSLNVWLLRKPFASPYSVFPLVVWVAIRFGPRGAATAAALLAASTIWHTFNGIGPFTDPNLTNIVLRLQTFLALNSLTGLLLAAVVTEREHADRGARENARRLSEAQAIAHVGSFEWDVAADRILWSDELHRIFGTAPDTPITYANLLERLHPRDRAPTEAIVRQSLVDHLPFTIEHRIVRPDGAERWLLTHGTVVLDASGRPQRMFGTAQDITERRTAEAALNVSEARFAGIVDIAPDAIVSVDDAQLIRLFNKGAEAIFGYAADELIGRPLNVIIPAGLAHTHHGRERREVLGRRKDGIEFIAEVSISELELEAGPVFTFILRDVTQRRRAEEALREREERFARMFQASPLASVLTAATDGRFIDLNQRFLELTGYTRDELIGRTSSAVRLWVPEERHQMIERLRNRQAVREHGISYCTKSGEWRRAVVSAELIGIGGEPCLLTLFWRS